MQAAGARMPARAAGCYTAPMLRTALEKSRFLVVIALGHFGGKD